MLEPKQNCDVVIHARIPRAVYVKIDQLSKTKTENAPDGFKKTTIMRQAMILGVPQVEKMIKGK